VIKHKLVLVEWVDSFGVGSAWDNVSDIKDVAHTCTSVGYLTLDGENIKVITPHISPERKDMCDETACGDMSIPCVSIIRMVDLNEVV